jgi:hypothetical protein
MQRRSGRGINTMVQRRAAERRAGFNAETQGPQKKSNSHNATSGPLMLAVIQSACMISDGDPSVKRECHMVRVLKQHSDTVVPD